MPTKIQIARTSVKVVVTIAASLLAKSATDKINGTFVEETVEDDSVAAEA